MFRESPENLRLSLSPAQHDPIGIAGYPPYCETVARRRLLSFSFFRHLPKCHQSTVACASRLQSGFNSSKSCLKLYYIEYDQRGLCAWCVEAFMIPRHVGSSPHVHERLARKFTFETVHPIRRQIPHIPGSARFRRTKQCYLWTFRAILSVLLVVRLDTPDQVPVADQASQYSLEDPEHCPSVSAMRYLLQLPKRETAFATTSCFRKWNARTWLQNWRALDRAYFCISLGNSRDPSGAS